MKNRIWFGIAILIIFLISVPVGASDYWVTLLTLILIFTVYAAGWNLFSGYSGYMSLGHAAFFGVGSYVSALAIVRLGISPYVCIILGGLASAAFAMAIGSVCLRIRGAYFAIVTFGLAELLRVLAVNLQFYEGTLGISVLPFPTLSIPA